MSPALDWIQAIRSVLRTELISDGNELREDDPHSKCAPVKIHRSGQCVFVSFNKEIENIKIQHRLFPLFQEISGIGRMCDYWIFYEHAPRNSAPTRYVFLVELKSGKDGGIEQLENAKLLAEYFLSMVSHHKQGDYSQVKIRGIVFSPAYSSPKSPIQSGQIRFQSKGRQRLEIAYLRDQALYYLPSFCD